MVAAPEIFNVLEAAPLFRGVPRRVLEPIVRNATQITLQPGARLLTPGTFNERVYIILAGHMSVRVTPSDTDKPVATLTTGECVGDMSVLVDGVVSAYVSAATACELLALDYTSFWSLLDGSDEAARNMLNILVQRIRLGNEIMADGLQRHDQLLDRSVFDGLTGLYNRQGIQGKFERLQRRCMESGEPICIILLELDAFDHAESEEERLMREQSLRTVAQILLTFLRPDDHAARLIGKKFAVLLAHTSPDEAATIAERLRAAVGEATILLPDGTKRPAPTISTGACEATVDDTWNALTARAEAALAQSIAAGRKQVVRSPAGN